jgi:hypothetical protein
VSRIVPQTRSPRSAKARTAAAPKPLLAPVMTMVLSVSTWVVLLLARCVTDWYEYLTALRQDIKYQW